MPKNLQWWHVLLGLALAFGLTVWTARDGSLTPLESGLVQFIALGVSVASSFAAGVLRASSQPQEHANSAVRRVWRLYQSLGRVLAVIQDREQAVTNSGDDDRLQVALASLQIVAAHLEEQVGTADDALEDWSHLAPGEVQRIRDQQGGA